MPEQVLSDVHVLQGRLHLFPGWEAKSHHSIVAPPLADDISLHSTSFGLEDRWLLWSRVRVYADRVVMTAWSFSCRHHREMSLNRIENITADEDRVTIHLKTGDHVVLFLDDPSEWASFVRDQRDIRPNPESG